MAKQIGVVTLLLRHFLVALLDHTDLGLEPRGPEQLSLALHRRGVVEETVTGLSITVLEQREQCERMLALGPAGLG
ncbi:hypothetical protein D3C80_2079790 [compost metagenome]